MKHYHKFIKNTTRTGISNPTNKAMTRFEKFETRKRQKAVHNLITA